MFWNLARLFCFVTLSRAHFLLILCENVLAQTLDLRGVTISKRFDLQGRSDLWAYVM